jgi:fumarylpyruvate hydrolase
MPAPEWTAPTVIIDGGGSFAARHVWCAGRNYAEHAREMGVDPARSRPVFFSKPAQAVVNHRQIGYPHETESLHHEVELVVLLANGGRDVPAADWAERIFGYAVGVDLTRRDVQDRLKKSSQPWEISKGFDQSAPIGRVIPATNWQPVAESVIELQVNGVVRQQASLGEMIWPVAELLQRLSAELSLNGGDVIFTGTPAGVGPLHRGDRVLARITGLPDLEFSIGLD